MAANPSIPGRLAKIRVAFLLPICHKAPENEVFRERERGGDDGGGDENLILKTFLRRK